MKTPDLEILLSSESLSISGLKYIPNYITIDKQNQLLDSLDQEEWSIESIEFKRRIQQHGYRYIYKDGVLVGANYLGPLPEWAQSIALRLHNESLTAIVPDQLTVNDYQPGEGLTSHIDCVTCFGNTIITLSLGSAYVMEFTHSQTYEKREILLLPGSLLVLQGEARYVWKHSAAHRKIDYYQGKEYVRSRRVALTFRQAVFPYK
ncbi:MAG: alpha-ketoglutarate-dependent dioxygenase AlkB [Cyanobacteriota bacterium]